MTSTSFDIVMDIVWCDWYVTDCVNEQSLDNAMELCDCDNVVSDWYISECGEFQCEWMNEWMNDWMTTTVIIIKLQYH